MPQDVIITAADCKPPAEINDEQYDLYEAIADLSAMFSSHKYAPLIPKDSRDITRLCIDWAAIFCHRNLNREWDGEYLVEIEAFFREQYQAWLKEAKDVTSHPQALRELDLAYCQNAIKKLIGEIGKPGAMSSKAKKSKSMSQAIVYAEMALNVAK